MRYIFLFLTFFFILFETSVTAQSNNKWVIVLDAGHGGKDPGALGKNSKEKDIALSIIKKTGEYIQNHFNDVEIIYTRKTDVFVDLYRRAEIANNAKADLFISVHCNSNPSTSPSGYEVFVMGLNKTEANLQVAMQENKSILMEDNQSANYDGIDPNSAEAYIAFSLYQNTHLERSLQIAKSTTDAFGTQFNMKNRGIKQAPFFVLYKTAMPSILIETAFISNLEDEAILMSASGQNKFAYAIYKAFVEYRNNIDKTSHNAIPIIKIEPPQTEQHSQNNTDDISTNTSKPEQIDTIGLVFKVQIASFKEKISIKDKRFSDFSNVAYSISGEYYKYYIGHAKSIDEIKPDLEKAKQNGYKDAFIVAFFNGKKISISEAMEKSNGK